MKETVAKESYVERWAREQKKKGIPVNDKKGIPVSKEKEKEVETDNGENARSKGQAAQED